MKKSEMIDSIAESTGMTKTNVEKVFNSTFDLFKSELKKNKKVAVAGFGTFKVSERAAREGHNPRTGEPVHIPASKGLSFKASSSLKEELN